MAMFPVLEINYDYVSAEVGGQWVQVVRQGQA